MEDRWTDRLSGYLDGELTPSEHRALEAHLASCPECAATLDELRGIVARAGSLTPRPPAADLWPGVEARLDCVRSVVTPFQTRVARRISFTMPQLVAAGLALMVVSAGGMWGLLHGGKATEAPPVAASSQVDPALVPASVADPRYDEAIADLEQALAAGRAQLDAGTVTILEANLDTIDKAIEQSRQALASDPANVYLHNHLAEARQRKLALLRRGVALVGSKS